MNQDITRDVYEGAGPDGIDVRVYSQDNSHLPSVTTILKSRDADTSARDDWQDRNDGDGNNAHHEHIFWYSRHVGTLGHWHSLSQVGDVPWSNDEEESKRQFFRIGTDAAEKEVEDSTPRDVLYSITKDHKGVETQGEFDDYYNRQMPDGYYTAMLCDVAIRDISFFTSAQARLRSKLGIDANDVIVAEKFLFDEEYNYAGQVDLVYDDDGDTVVADLKSSSGCYRKHQLQSAAYASAVERADGLPSAVDRIEVHRTHPRSGEMAVHVPDESSGVFTDKYWEDSYEDLWAEFRDLAEAFDYEHNE